MLQWDETEFIGILETIPEVIKDEAGLFHAFNIIKNGIHLELTIYPFEEDVRFRIFRYGENHQIFEYQIMGCKFARHEVGDGKNSYLSFTNKNNLEVTVSVHPDNAVIVSE